MASNVRAGQGVGPAARGRGEHDGRRLAAVAGSLRALCESRKGEGLPQPLPALRRRRVAFQGPESSLAAARGRVVLRPGRGIPPDRHGNTDGVSRLFHVRRHGSLDPAGEAQRRRSARDRGQGVRREPARRQCHTAGCSPRAGERSHRCRSGSALSRPLRGVGALSLNGGPAFLCRNGTSEPTRTPLSLVQAAPPSTCDRRTGRRRSTALPRLGRR